VEGLLGWEICKTLVYFLFIDLTILPTTGYYIKQEDEWGQMWNKLIVAYP
jgi:hypothetical protein